MKSTLSASGLKNMGCLTWVSFCSRFSSGGVDYAPDITGQNINAVLYNSPTKQGVDDPLYCIGFNGSDEYAQIDLGVACPSALTICFWYKPEEVGGVIVKEITPTEGYHAAILELVSGTLKARLYNLPSPYLSGGALTTLTWYHIALTYDGTYVRLYVDGILVTTSGTFTRTASNPCSFQIAKSDTTHMGDGTYNHCNVRHFMVFNQTLTQDVIAAIMFDTYLE